MNIDFADRIGTVRPFRLTRAAALPSILASQLSPRFFKYFTFKSMKLCSLAVAVGCSLLALNARAAFTDGDVADLGFPQPNATSPIFTTAVSSDGSSVVGFWLSVPTGTSQHAWTALDHATKATNVVAPSDVGSLSLTGIDKVNNSNVVVGTFRSLTHPDDSAFYSPAGSIVPMAIPGLTGKSYAQGINANGAVVGNDASGSFVYSTAQPASAPLRFTAAQLPGPNRAYAINNAGAVTGWTTNAVGQHEAFVGVPQTGPVSLPSIKVKDSSGQAVPAIWSEARGINAGGDIVGCGSAAAIGAGGCGGTIVSPDSGIQAFVVRNGVATSLGVPSAPGKTFDESFALGISDHGLVVGTAHSGADPTMSRAFLWYFESGELKTVDLTATLLPLFPHGNSFLSLLTATAVTDSLIGTTATTEKLNVTIVGLGIAASDKLTHPFSLNFDMTVAVPEPETWFLLLTGLAFAGWVARRRLHPALVRASR